MPIDILYAPEELETLKSVEGRIKIFLGGSIEMGAAEDWQSRVAQELSSKSYADQIILMNPRRKDWDSSWSQDPHTDPFREQVTWELRHQSKADVLVYYFCAKTVSPITLLEFGIHCKDSPVVGVHPDYGRFGNMVLTCEYLGVPFKRNWDGFISALDMRIHQELSK